MVRRVDFYKDDTYTHFLTLISFDKNIMDYQYFSFIINIRFWDEWRKVT